MRKKRFHKKDTKKSSGSNIKSFFRWFSVYFISIILLNLLFEKTKIYQTKIGFYLIIGFILVIISRVFYSAIKRKSFRFKGIILWGVIYSVVFGLIDYFLKLLPQIRVNLSLDKYIFILIFSVIFTIVLMFLRRMKIKTGRLKAPSQIFSGIILLVAGILTFRFSYQIFIGWFSWAEGMAWSWLIGLGLIIGGILTLIAWWRNNVLTHHIGLRFGRIK